MAWNASALSLGSPRGNVVLGAPFDLVVGLQPDSGNDAGSSCVRAELLAGDRPIESSRVSVSPTSSGKAVRVQARYTVDEPIVTLKLWAGCEGGGISRSYTLLAQLPDSVDASGNQPINVRELAAAQPALPTVGAAAAAGAGAGAAGVAGTASESSSTPSRAAAARSARSDARPATTPAPKEAQPQPKPKPKPKPKTAAEKSRPPVGVTAQAQAGQRQAGLRIEPRLRMEPVEEWLGTGGTPGAAGAAGTPGTPGTPEGGAASAAPMFDAGSEQLAEANKRVQALEAEMAAFKKRDGVDRGQLAQLRAELDAMRQESGGSSWLFNALLLALIAAVAVIGWMAWRMRSGASLFSREQNAWRESVERSSQDPVPSTPPHVRDDEIHTLPHSLDPHRPTRPMAPSLREHRPAAPQQDDRRGPDTLASPYVQRGAQMRPGVTYELHEDVDPGDFGPATIPVPVSVHAELETEPAPQAPAPVRTSAPEAIKARRMVQPGELFDVQQQAEFFISVGEHQQAIELLRSHIDTHEDSSPLAYLELLHLYYTLSRRDDFDQLRARFARHFNARVPAMPGFTDKGSSLLQGYPEQLARIEALWPVDEVETCLAHYLFKQDGAPDPDAPAPFDLAAFDDLLLLLSIARTSPAGTRGEPGPRERTTPRMVAGTAAAGAATAGAAAFTAAAETTPAQAPASAATGVDWMAELQPPIEPAQPQPASLTPLEPGLEFTPMDTLPLSTGAVGGGDKPASSAPDSLSAPLHFELQPLNFDLDQAGQLPAGQVRSVPLGEAPSFIHDESAPLLDIDLTDLGENELPHVDVPSRFPPVTLSMPGSGAVGFSSHNLKAPLDMDLALDKWELEPPDTVREHRGLDEPLSRSVDMLLSRETDPAFRSSPQAPSPQADDKDPPKG
ncbi:FimV family protein [Delftia sp. HK171]|uniref:type IV pilus assembly protein FimV n=1 Tax=Delftia sp. HK171 TaxID=1920191 RepID=UPI00114FE045|nr:hypothetical protein [Delftia sp. HK171]TQL65226.1 hypothetical protein FB549_5575 [Delftia sp. HK171]